MVVTTPVGFDTRAEKEVERMPPRGTRNERRFQKLENMDPEQMLTSIKVELLTKVNKLVKSNANQIHQIIMKNDTQLLIKMLKNSKMLRNKVGYF